MTNHMIAYLKGQIIKKTDKEIILLVNNIGYQIFLPEKFLSKIHLNSDLELFVYHKQREDAQELYGFETFEEREFFIQLLSVSGVGPKSAINVLSIASPEDLKSAIISQNAEMFKKVSGIGSKTAERIVIDLKNKLGGINFYSSNDSVSNNKDLEVFEALSSLGFSDNEIRNIYNQIPKDLEKSSEKIKYALKLLKK